MTKMFSDNNPFKKYATTIDDINRFEDIDFINNHWQKWFEDLDNMWFEFLIENGYKVDKPYNIKQLENLRDDLAKEDKVLDYFEYLEYNDGKKGMAITRHLIPFFNSISNPLTNEDKERIIERWKEQNAKNKSG